MTYIDLINQFWQKDLEFSFTSTEVAVYFRLLDRCNRLGWKSPFNLSGTQLMVQLKLLTKKPFDTARKTLRDAGLIEFKNGNGRGCTTEYTIVGVGSTPKPLPERGKKNTPLSAPLSGIVSAPLSGVVSGLLHKTKTRLDKEEANASGASVDFSTQKKGASSESASKNDSLRLSAEKDTVPNPVAAVPSPATLPPTFEVFWDAFGKKQDKYKCKQRWDALGPAEQHAAISAVTVYVLATPEKRYRKNPITWLNGKCWLDEEMPLPRVAPHVGSPPPPASAGGTPSKPHNKW